MSVCAFRGIQKQIFLNFFTINKNIFKLGFVENNAKSLCVYFSKKRFTGFEIIESKPAFCICDLCCFFGNGFEMNL